VCMLCVCGLLYEEGPARAGLPIPSVGKTKKPPRTTHPFATGFYSRQMCFHSRFVEYENCKRPRRNNTQKRENCKLSKCNFHISLQFSYQFAILTFRGMVPTWMFAILISVCNSHISLQFSRHTLPPAYVALLVPCHYDPTHQSATHIRLKQTPHVPRWTEHQKKD
jgi:hypothetical protein